MRSAIAGDQRIVTGSNTHGSAANYDPSPYFVTVNTSGTLGTPVAILADSGASGQDQSDTYWGEYVSVSSTRMTMLRSGPWTNT